MIVNDSDNHDAIFKDNIKHTVWKTTHSHATYPIAEDCGRFGRRFELINGDLNSRKEVFCQFLIDLLVPTI